MKTIILCMAALPVVSAVLSVWCYFLGDRSGNSGRMTHIDSNPRIKNCKGE